MKKVVTIFASFLLFLLSFQIVSAKVVITEVMYDLPKDSGSDAGREWVEVFNNGTDSVDLSSWRFYEDGVNHKLKVLQGKGILHGGSYAVIADNPKKFLADNSSFSGTVFDSSFSLKNTGERIVLRNNELADIDSITYDTSKGANGDGNSLQKTDSGWSALSPTPGSSSSGSQPISTQVVSVGTQSEKSVSQPVDTNGNAWPVEPQIFAHIKSAQKIAIAGAGVLFEGSSLGLQKIPLKGARYMWTFGDGGKKEGVSVLYHYSYPGMYVVILNVSSGKYSASSRMNIKVISSDISIFSIGNGRKSFIEIYNKTKYELNLSWWRLRVGNKIFTIPKDTIILQNSKVIFPAQNTKFEIKKDENVDLLYPNGAVAYSYPWKLGLKKTASVISFVPVQTIRSSAPKASYKKSKIKTTKVLKKINTIKKDKIENSINKNQTANVFTVADGGSDMYKWLLGVVGISALSIFGVFLVRREKSNVNMRLPTGNYSEPSLLEQNSDVDEYEIIEDDED